MKLLKVKTARFAEVVEKCGAPESYTLWLKPRADKQLQTLRKNQRVMTIQQTDSGTDFGVTDFCERKGARYLAFPKSLKPFKNMRVVGINWGLVKS